MDIFAIAGLGTNFMFSLGIIFVIIFVVFYIRQRLSNFDHKINSMFGLINAMADEINDLKKTNDMLSNANNAKIYVPGQSDGHLPDPMNMTHLMNPMNSQLLDVSDDDSDNDSDDSDDESDSDDEHNEKTIEIMENNLEEDTPLVFDEITKTSIPVEIVDEETFEEDDIGEVKIIDKLQTQDFKKMSVKELRQHIEENQLTDQDISKMKKSELLELCA